MVNQPFPLNPHRKNVKEMAKRFSSLRLSTDLVDRILENCPKRLVDMLYVPLKFAGLQKLHLIKLAEGEFPHLFLAAFDVRQHLFRSLFEHSILCERV